MRFAIIAVLVGACHSARPEISGSALMLSMTPTPPSFTSGYDFELLEVIKGTSCTTRVKEWESASSIYWLGMIEVEKLAVDDLTRRAIRAAMFDALSNLKEADTLLLTRLMTEGSGPNKVCATVYGRAIRLKKGMPTTSKSNEVPEADEDSEAVEAQ